MKGIFYDRKDILCKCHYCNGYFKLERNEGVADNEMYIPKVLAPTIEDLEEYIKNELGQTYESMTGNELKDSFEIGIYKINHISVDDDNEAEKHSLGMFECWHEIV